MRKKQICYICNSNEILERRGTVRDNSTLKILECNNCGLVFLSSFAHIDQAFYENSKMHEDSSTVDIKSWINMTEEDDQRMFEYIKNIISDKLLLDFGCGNANFMLKTKKIAADVCGVDLETRLEKYYIKKNLNVYKTIENIPKGKRFDLITLKHVLEHIPKPDDILKSLSRLLNKNGQIVIEVPNAEDALISLYECDSFTKFTYWSCHLYLFSQLSLKLLAEKADIKLNYIKQIQRYNLGNHLYWLAKGKPGGHEIWNFLNSPHLHSHYEKTLETIGKCDTLLASFSIKSK